MDNRFLEMSARRTGGAGLLERQQRRVDAVRRQAWSAPFSAIDRALVVLVENGGVDLGIPTLVDKIVGSLPGASVLPDSFRADLQTFLETKIKGMTDSLLESADLAFNGFSKVKPDLYGEVIVLRDSTASYAELKKSLLGLSSAGKTMDVVILTHGGTDTICAAGNITGSQIRDLRAANGGVPLRIRSVYMMNCVGSSLNQAWLDAGAKVSAGTIRNNYLPEPTTHHFWTMWQGGAGFESAVNGAYRQTISEINDVINAFIRTVSFGASAVLGAVDVSSMDFVTDSAPVVKSDTSVTVGSDALSFAASDVRSLSTTVLPDRTLQALSEGVAASQRTLSPGGMTFIQQWEATPRAALRRSTGQTIESLVGKAEQALNGSLSAPVTQDQFDALVSFVLGIGGKRFEGSKVFQLLRDGSMSAIPAEMRKWMKVNQDGAVLDDPVLVGRRDAEARLFEGQGATPVQSQSIRRRLTMPLSAVDYAIPGLLPPIKQPTPMTCWAAVMTMMTSWRTASSMSIPDALARIGPSYVTLFNAGGGLSEGTAASLYTDAGLVTMTSFNPSIEGWESLLRQFGPLYVDVGYPGVDSTHAIIVTAIKGDGNREGTTITYTDPWTGTVVNQQFADFQAAYESPGAVRWPHTIVHWPAEAAAAGAQSMPLVRSYEYQSPSSQAVSQSLWSYGQSPGVIIAGIEVVDAIQIGLGAASIVQSQVGASQGSFALTYAQAQRLLTPEARAAMPGAQAAKRSFSQRLFHIGSSGPAGDWAQAEVIIEWEGDPYGEIGTPVIRRDLTNSSDWSKSSANLQIMKLERIPPAGTDPRTWPIVYSYEGTFDPVGNGYFEFSGEFEINPFGGLKFNRHEVVSRSLLDFAISGSPGDYVRKGDDVSPPVPAIPDDQIAYLKTHPPT